MRDPGQERESRSEDSESGFKRIPLFTNLGILAVATGARFFGSGRGDLGPSMNYMAQMMVLVTLLAFANVAVGILCMFIKAHAYSATFFLSAFAVLIIGAGACFVGGAVLEAA